MKRASVASGSQADDEEDSFRRVSIPRVARPAGHHGELDVISEGLEDEVGSVYSRVRKPG